MEQGFVWQGEYGKRKHLIPVLKKLLREQEASSLEMLALFANNNPYNLELFIVTYYKIPQKDHIESMMQEFQNAGLILRNDLTALSMIKEMGCRRFNAAAFADEASVDMIFSSLFGIPEISELESKGYYMRPYGKNGQVFISHSSKDKKDVESIIPYLNAQNLPVWFDKYSITVGSSITESVQTGIENSDIVIFWITNNFLLSRWCNMEMRAFIKKLIEENCKIIMVLDDSIDIKQLPLFLRDYKYIRKNYRSNFEIAEELIQAIKRIV